MAKIHYSIGDIFVHPFLKVPVGIVVKEAVVGTEKIAGTEAVAIIVVEMGDTNTPMKTHIGPPPINVVPDVTDEFRRKKDEVRIFIQGVEKTLEALGLIKDLTI